ncbi:MAG: hypothetical protein ACYTBJ_00045 [Planctomycetota bacterium]|jgi:hypothetical protein
MSDKGRMKWVYEQRGRLHQMALDLCLDGLTLAQAIGVLELRYGADEVRWAVARSGIVRDLQDSWTVPTTSDSDD